MAIGDIDKQYQLKDGAKGREKDGAKGREKDGAKGREKAASRQQMEAQIKALEARIESVTFWPILILDMGACSFVAMNSPLTRL
jgi:hypothetical protein